MTVSFARSQGATPAVTCSVTSARSVDAGIASLEWSCEPRPKDARSGSDFQYAFDHPSDPWFATFQGPTATVEKRLSAESDDPGEGFPGSCPCYDYDVSVPSYELFSAAK